MKLLNVKVTPNAKKDEIIEEVDIFGNIIYKIKTTKPPEDNKANNSVIEILAKHSKTSKSNIKIIKGLTSRSKIIELKLD